MRPLKTETLNPCLRELAGKPAKGSPKGEMSGSERGNTDNSFPTENFKLKTDNSFPMSSLSTHHSRAAAPSSRLPHSRFLLQPSTRFGGLAAIILAFATLMSFAGSAHAQTSYTSTSNTTAWNTTRWNNSSDVAPYGSAYTANNSVSFTSGNYSIGGMGAALDVGNVTLSNTVSVNFTSVSSTYATGGKVRTITVGSGATFDLQGQSISTAAGVGFIKEGQGVFALAGAGYSGGFTLNNGTVILRGTTALGNGTLTLNGGTLAGSATRDLSGKATGITIGGNVKFGEIASNVSLASDTANLTCNATVSLGGAERTLTVGNNGTHTLNGVFSNGGLVIARAAGVTGKFVFGGINTYTGNTTISGGTLALTGSGSIATSPNITIASGAGFDVSATTSGTALASTQNLTASANGTNTTGTITVASSQNLTLGGSSARLTFSGYGGGATPPLTVAGASAGALALNNTPVTVTTTSALAAGNYTLIAKSGSATVTGSPGALTTNGSGSSGLASGTAGSLAVTSGQLILTVTASSPTISSTGTPAALSTTYGSNSSVTSFSVNGTNMSAGIVVTPPAGFQVSTDNSTFSSSNLTVGSSGTISSTPVYLRIPNTTAAGTYSGNITLTSANATQVNVATVSSTVSAKALTISGLTAANKTYDGTTTASVTGTPAYSGLVNSESFSVSDTVTWAFPDANVGNSKTLTRTGNFTAPNANYSITQLTLSANIAAATPTLAFISASSAIAGGTVTLNATSASTGAVSYSSSNTSVATISGTTLTAVAAGTTTITASQVADTNYNAASATQTFTVSAASSPTIITSGSLSAVSTTYGTASASPTSFTVSGSTLNANLTVTAPTGFEVSTSLGSGYASSLTLTQSSGSVASTTIYVRLAAATAVGTYSGNIAVSGGGATTQNVATASSTVSAKALTITGLSAADKTYDGNATVSVTGTAAFSGLVTGESGTPSGSVTWAFPDANAGSNKSLTRTGTYSAPSANYSLTQPSLTANITAASVTVTANATSKTYGATDPVLGYTSSPSSLIGGNSFTGSLTRAAGEGVGTYAISQGSLSAGSNYAMTFVGANLTISKASQSITFGALSAQTYGNSTFSLNATASSSLTVNYTSSNTSVATIAGSTVTIVGAGSTTITAAQAGDSNYNAATSVNQTLTVNQATTSITFPALSNTTAGNASYSAGVTVTPAAAVIAYTSSNPSVATVGASNGTITPLAPGVTTITASVIGTANYTAATANRTLNVAAAGGGSVTGVIAGWDFGSLTSGGTSPLSANTKAANITVGGLTRGSGMDTVGASVNATFGANNTTSTDAAGAASGNDFVTFTISANSSYTISLSAINSYNVRRSSTGSTTGQWQYSTNGSTFNDFGGAITWGSGTTAAGNTQPAIDLSSTLPLQNIPANTTVTFRVLVYGASAAGGTWYLNNSTAGDDFTISGTVSSPQTPAITPSGTFGALTSTYGTASAGSAPVAVSGGSLTANITATAPSANFEVSSDNSTWGSTATFAQSSGFANGSLYLRLSSSAAVGNYTSQNVTLSSTGASNATISIANSSVNATTAGAPTITAITADNSQLSVAFTAPVSNGGASITNYQYSTDGGSNWTTRNPVATTSPLVITGLTNETPYNVQLRAVNSAGNGTASGTTQGTPVAPSNPSITPSLSTITGFTSSYPSAGTAQALTVNAALLTPASGSLTVTGSTNYEVSTTSSSAGFGSSATLSYSGSTLSSGTANVWIRLKANLAVASYNSETISISGGGATTQNITVSGSVTSGTPPTLSASGSASVDGAFTVTFADDATWRAAITGVTVNGTTLTAGYAVSSGQITFTPSASNPTNLLQSAGSKAIVISAGNYTTASVTQTISAGAASNLIVTTQPAAPASNGAALATQPVVTLRDQYNNTATGSSTTVTAAVGSGTWTLGGTAAVSASSGVVTFSGLTATSAAAVTGATINFTASGVTSNTSTTFNIPAPVLDYVSLTATGTAATENFDTLANTGTSSTLPQGWAISESDSSADSSFAAGTGSDNGGNSYSFGAASDSERALGGLRSGTVIPSWGAKIRNNTGQTITNLDISYTGEQWRLGATGRADTLTFQYSTDATSLTTGNWTTVAGLAFTAPVSSGTAGALNGNASGNRTAVSNSITGISVASGGNFWIRWQDNDATGSDDGIGIDDFSITGLGNATMTIGGTSANATAADFTTTYGTASANQTFTIGGSSLQGNVTATAGTGFQVSSDGTTYGATATFTRNATYAASGTLYARLTATATASGNYTSATVATLSSANATSLVITTDSAGSSVSRATSTVSVAPTASAITYGQTLASSVLSGGTASVAGTYAFTTPATAPSVGTASQSVTFTPTDSANYNTASTSASVTVNKATPTVSVAPTASGITYGQTLASSTLSGGTASTAGTYAFTTPATAPSAGAASQPVTFTPTDTASYNTASTTASVTVSQATPTISVAPTASNITIGQTLANSTLSGGTASVNGTFAFTTPSTAPALGISSQGVTFTPTDSTNYTAQTTSANVGVLCLAPTLTRATVPVAGGFTVNWNAATGAGNYTVLHSASKNMTGATSVNTASTSVAITGLSNGLRYVQVRANNAAGASANSTQQVNQLQSIAAGATSYLSAPGEVGTNTVAGIFGSANEAGLAAGATDSASTTILLLNSNGATANTIFYNSSVNEWREGATAMDATAIAQGKAFILKNNTGSTDYFLLVGTPREGGSQPTVSLNPAGNYTLCTTGRTTPTTIANMNLNPGTGAGQFKAAPKAKDADKVIVVDQTTGAATNYYHNGTTWMDGLRAVPSAEIPAGQGFFIKKASNSTFSTWTLPAE